ncbi:MAG: hypothetical protein GX542_06285 [Rhodococcus sp.]|nr:hypothetical protein [Rhodococcus sp. (in: high G+C Gram-positive bacteria)]
MPVPTSWTNSATAERVALVLPAMGVAAAYYSRFAGHLADAGFQVGVAEMRGRASTGRPRVGAATMASGNSSTMCVTWSLTLASGFRRRRSL